MEDSWDIIRIADEKINLTQNNEPAHKGEQWEIRESEIRIIGNSPYFADLALSDFK